MFGTKKERILYVMAHSYDDLMLFGVDILMNSRRNREVHLLLCTQDPRTEKDESDVQALYHAAAVLGLQESRIHVPKNRAKLGTLKQDFAEKLVGQILELMGEDVLICAPGPNNGSEQHGEHKSVGRAIDALLRNGKIQKAKFFVEPEAYEEIVNHPYLLPWAPFVVKIPKFMENKIRNIAAKDFGYELVQPVSCCWYVKWNPKRKTKLQKWVEQYRRWKKLWSQNINFYSSGGCDAPDLENLKLVCIKSGEVDKYRDFCEMHDYQFREKDLGRIRDGSSFWCLTQEDGTVVSTGWLAYKSQFCIGEIDYSFQMTNSRTGILFDFNTKQEYRGNGYYGILLRSILANAQEPECFMIYTSPVNTASAKGIIKAGFHYDGTFCSRNGSAKRYLRAIGMHSLKRKIMFCGLYVRK